MTTGVQILALILAFIVAMAAVAVRKINKKD